MIGDLKPAAIRRVPRPTAIDPDSTIVSGRYNSRSNSSSTPTAGGGHPMEGYVLGRLSTRYVI